MFHAKHAKETQGTQSKIMIRFTTKDTKSTKESQSRGTSLFNLVIPAVCYSCRRRIPVQKLCLCVECSAKLQRKKEYLIGEMALGDKHFDKAVSIFNFDFKVRELIHDFKYRGIKEIGNYFSDIAIDVLKREYLEFINVDFVVSVPMAKVQQRERLFNQAEYLSKRITQGLGLKDYSHLVTKTRRTEKQALKDFDMRMKGRLEIATTIYAVKDKHVFEGKTVLVIDDVFTSGATANEFSKALKECGVKKIYVFAVASGNVKPVIYPAIRRQIKTYSRKELMRDDR